MSGSPEREVKEFYFKQVAQVRLFAATSNPGAKRRRLLVTANKYGLTFAAFNSTVSELKVFRTSQLSTLSASSASTIIEEFDYWSVVPLGAEVLDVGISSDHLTLSVTVERAGSMFAYMYDTRSFAVKGVVPQPFVDVRLSTVSDVELLDLSWNPGVDYPRILATCLSDGSVSLWEIAEGLKIAASLPTETGAKCLCWSPKGKQLVVGKMDGSFTNYDQLLQRKKEISAPTLFQPNTMTLCDVFWQSTYTYVGSYTKLHAPNEPPTVIVVSTSKAGPVTYTNFEDVCYGSGEDRKHKFYVQQIIEWDMMLVSSTNSMESAVIGKSEDQSKWERWSLDDTGRAETPMNDDYCETMPLGAAIDITSQNDIIIDDTKTHPASPIYMLLSSDGILVSFHMIHTRTGYPSIMAPAMGIPTTGARKPPAGVAAFATSTPAKAPMDSLGGAFGQQSAIKPPGNGLGLFQPKPTTLQSTVLPSAQNSTPSGFNSTATTTAPFSFTDKSVTTANTTLNTVAPSATLAGTTSTSKSLFSFTNNASTATTSSGTFNFTNSATPQATGTSLFGSNAANQPSTPLSSANVSAVSNPVPVKPVPISGAKPTTPVQVVQSKPSGQPVAPVAMASTIHSTGALSGAHPKATGNSTTAKVQPGEQDSALVTAEQTDTVQTDHFYMGSIINEIKLFHKELSELRKKCNSNCVSDIGNSKEMTHLKTETEEMMAFSTEIKQLTNSQNIEISELKPAGLNAFAMVEESRHRNNTGKQQKNLSESYSLSSASSQVLQQKALDPASAKRLKDIRSQYQYVDATLREVDQQLDSQWDQYQIKKKNKSRLQTPATDHVYETVKTHHTVIASQKAMVERICNDLQALKMKQQTLVSPREDSSFSISSQGSPQRQSHNLRGTNASSPLCSVNQSPASVVSPEKMAALRDHLSKRRVTPVKSTIPANLSFSKISSADSFSRRLSVESSILKTPPKSSTHHQKSTTKVITPGRATPDSKSGSGIAPKETTPGFSSAIGMGTISEIPATQVSHTSPALSVFEKKATPIADFAPSKSKNATSSMSSMAAAAGMNVPSAKNFPSAPITATTASSTAFNFSSTTKSTGFKFNAPDGTSVVSFAPTTTTSTTANKTGSNVLQGVTGFSGFGGGNTSSISSTFQSKATSNPASPLATGNMQVKPKVLFTGRSTDAENGGSAFEFGKSATMQSSLEQSKGTFGATGAVFGDQATPSRDNLNFVTIASRQKNIIGSTGNPPPAYSETQNTTRDSKIIASSSTLDKVTTEAADSSTTSLFTGSSGVSSDTDKSVISASVGLSSGTSVSKSLFGNSAASTTKPTSSTSDVSEPIVSNLSKETESVSGSQTSSIALLPPRTVKESVTTSAPTAVASSETISSSSSGVSSVAATTTLFTTPKTSSVFGGAQSNNATTTSLFGVPTSTSSSVSLFGNQSKAKGSVFDTATLTSSDVSGPITSSSGGLFDKTTTATMSTSGSTVGITCLTGSKPTTTTATASSLFRGAPGTTSSVFGGASTTTGTTSSLFGGGPTTTVTTSSVFGGTSTPTATTSSAFGTTPATTGTTNSLFGDAPTTTGTTSSIFGVAPTTTVTASSVFGGTSTPTVTTSSLFGGAPATNVTTSSVFGGTSTPTVTTSSLFGGAPATNVTTSSLFGGAPTTTVTTSSVFGGTPATTVTTSSLFGGTSTATGTTSSLFGGTLATTSANAFAFGSTSSSANTSSVFGNKSDTSTTPGSLFGTTTLGDTTTQSVSVFGTSDTSNDATGGMFGGLGGKPSAENANKNVFGSTSFGSGAQNSGLFGSSTGSTFGSTSQTTTPSAGSFGSGATFGGADATPTSTAGFGSFQSSAPAAGFGSPPSFGSVGGFGSTPGGFGGTPAFGNSPQSGSSVFGQAGANSSSGFASFAEGSTASFSSLSQNAAQSPTFGGVAQQGSGGFGALGQQGGTGSIFGQPTAQPPGSGLFGTASGASPGFNSGAAGNFGAADGFTSPGGSSFTSHRG